MAHSFHQSQGHDDEPRFDLGQLVERWTGLSPDSELAVELELILPCLTVDWALLVQILVPNLLPRLHRCQLYSLLAPGRLLLVH